MPERFCFIFEFRSIRSLEIREDTWLELILKRISMIKERKTFEKGSFTPEKMKC